VGLTSNCINQLKIITKTNQSPRSFKRMDGSIVKTFAIADAVSSQVKGHTGDHYKIEFSGIVRRENFPWLGYTE